MQDSITNTGRPLIKSKREELSVFDGGKMVNDEIEHDGFLLYLFHMLSYELFSRNVASITARKM